MADKLPPCCARRVAVVARAEGELRSLARKAARAPHRREHWTKLIAKAKAERANARQGKIDHEADHAGEAAA